MASYTEIWQHSLQTVLLQNPITFLFYPREVVCQHSWNDETVSLFNKTQLARNALDGFCYLNDLSIQRNAYGGHVGLQVFKLLLGKCTHTRLNQCCRKYGDGHLNQVSIQNLEKLNEKLWRICDLPHHIYGGHVGFRFSVVDGSISLSYLRSLLMKMWEQTQKTSLWIA